MDAPELESALGESPGRWIYLPLGPKAIATSESFCVTGDYVIVVQGWAAASNDCVPGNPQTVRAQAFPSLMFAIDPHNHLIAGTIYRMTDSVPRQAALRIILTAIASTLVAVWFLGASAAAQPTSIPATPSGIPASPAATTVAPAAEPPVTVVVNPPSTSSGGGLSQPWATLLTGIAAVLAAAFAFGGLWLNRLQTEKHFASSHELAQTRAMRERYTVCAQQIADDKPSIRQAGVYGLAALADDWRAFANSETRSKRVSEDVNDEVQVCINLLCAVLRTSARRRGTINLPSVLFAVWRTLPTVAAARRPLAGATEEQLRPLLGQAMAARHGGGAAVRAAALEVIARRSEEWSQYRFNFAGADLFGANLANARFAEANLRNTTLWSTDFRGADLNGADFSGANLKWADLEGADLRGAKFFGADLNGARLMHAQVGGADFTAADVTLLRVDAETLADLSLTVEQRRSVRVMDPQTGELVPPSR